MKVHLTYMNGIPRLAATAFAAVALVTVSLVWGGATVSANHPVYVEGNCLNPPAGNPGPVTPGTCGDYDGDGRIGTAEDADGDRVFGTITAALGGGTGANQNGRVVIVTSGTFAEVVNITGANGNVQLEAAPGVDANIDAVLQGDPGSGARQNAPGIIVNAPADRFITIRNIVSRNWATGIDVRGFSRVLIDRCRVDNNTNFGILVQGTAKVKINDTQVTATGFRVGATGDFPRANRPDPGVGIEFQDDSSGLICDSCVVGNFGAGIRNGTRDNGKGFGNSSVQLQNVCAFDNNPNYVGVKAQTGPGKDR